MVVHMAMEHPYPRIVGHHVGRQRGGGQQFDHILAVAADQHGIACQCGVCRATSVPGASTYQRSGSPTFIVGIGRLANT